jgi:hypothetical protein
VPQSVAHGALQLHRRALVRYSKGIHGPCGLSTVAFGTRLPSKQVKFRTLKDIAETCRSVATSRRAQI